MEDKYVRNSLRFFIGVLLLAVLYSCANIASPNGGPYDEAPPKFVSSTPLPCKHSYFIFSQILLNFIFPPVPDNLKLQRYHFLIFISGNHYDKSSLFLMYNFKP